MKFWHTLSSTMTLMLSDTFSLTCSLWYVFSYIIPLICSLWYVFSYMLSLTCSLWHALSDMISPTCFLWHSNSPKQFKNLTRNNLSDNARKLACIFHHQSAVHISASICLPLESICLTSAYQRWFWKRECPRLYRTAVIGCCYQHGVSFLSILPELFFHSHTSQFISSMSVMSW